MSVSVIKSEHDYKRALAEVEALVDQDPPRGSEAAARLDVLGTALAAYEQEHYSFGKELEESREREPRGVPLDDVLKRYEEHRHNPHLVPLEDAERAWGLRRKR